MQKLDSGFFFRFCAVKMIFVERTQHNFYLTLQKQEINPAEKASRNVYEQKLERNRSKFRENVRPELMPSVVSSIRQE